MGSRANNAAIRTAALLLAAALPDLDSWHSYTGRLVPFISLPLENH